MSDPKGIVLISGVNGYIASHCAKAFLESGFSVRGTVRRLGSAQKLTNEAFKAYAEAGKFEVVEVPDITVEGAFDNAVTGVQHILHAASPLGLSFTDPAPILHAAVTGTTTLLASALLHAGPSLKSILHLSSIAAVKTLAEPPYTFTEKDWNDWAEPLLVSQGNKADGPTIYVASKAASERAFWKFREEKKPGFAMAALNPVFVIGPAILPPRTESQIPATTLWIYQIFAGAAHPPPNTFLPQVVDVRDIAALASALVLSPSKSVDGERYIASSSTDHPQAVADILRRSFPSSVKSRIQPGNPGEGYDTEYRGDASKMCMVDSSKAARKMRDVLGEEKWKDWIGYEESVIDTARSFEGLL